MLEQKNNSFIKNIIAFCVYHPTSVLMMLLGICLCCIISVRIIHQDFLPKIEERNILVSAEFEGISAQEMKSLVTIPLEDSESSLKGIKNITSITRDGLSLVIIELHWSTDIELAITECREIIDQCFQTLPNGCSKPTAKIFNPSQKEIISILVEPKDNDMEYGRYIIDNDIKQRLQRIEGISSVNVSGGEKTEIHIELDKSKVENSFLTLQGLSQAIASSNYEYPIGTITSGNKELLVKTSGLYKSIEDINETPVSFGDNGTIRIQNIGTVSYGKKDKSTFYVHDGKECICIELYKKSDASPITVSENVKKELKVLTEMYGSTLDFKINNDSSLELRESIAQLVLSAVIGIFITVFILFLFLKSIRTSLLASSIIPLTILFSIFMLAIFKKTINILSISGITVGLGMVIDPAVITIENVSKKLAQNKNPSKIKEDIIEATNELVLSSTGSTITTIVVFIPFFFLSGITGKLFSDMSIAVISSISFAWILSITYIPAMCFLLTKKNLKNNSFSNGQNLLNLEKKYCNGLSFVFNHRWIIAPVLIFCILLSVVLLFCLKKEMLPSTHGNNISAFVYFPEGTLIETMKENSLFITDKLKENKSISSISITGGVEKDNYIELASAKTRFERLKIVCTSSDIKSAKQSLENLLHKANVDFFIEEDNNILKQILSIQNDIYILTSETEKTLLDDALSITGNTSFITPYSFSNEYVFTPDRDSCTRFSVTTAMASQTTRDTLEGVYASSFYKDGIEIPIKIKFNKNDVSSIEKLENSIVVTEDKGIKLSSLGTIAIKKNEKILYRYNKKDSKQLIKNDSFIIPSKENIISMKKIQIDELFRDTGLILVVILLLLYCVMGAQFESFLAPCLMFAAIPPAFCGAFLFLFLFRQTININSVIALVVLFGTSVNNAIIFYEASLNNCSKNRNELIKTFSSKLRPILITSLTTIFALIPFAIDPSNKNSQASMSIAIIGGLLTSLLIVLFIVPPLLEQFVKYKTEKNL